MGKDDKQRRSGKSASSSRAAELLEASGIDLSFLGLGTQIAESSVLPKQKDKKSAKEPKIINAQPQSSSVDAPKREPWTREKAIESLCKARESDKQRPAADEIDQQQMKHQSVEERSSEAATIDQTDAMDAARDKNIAANDLTTIVEQPDEQREVVPLQRLQEDLKDVTKPLDVVHWNELGANHVGSIYAAEQFEPTISDFSANLIELDAIFIEELLFVENMLATFALSDAKLKLRLNDADKRSRLAHIITTAAILQSSSTFAKLYNSITYALVEAYANNTIVQTDVHRQIPAFLRLWQHRIASWNMVEELANMINLTLKTFAATQIPFTLLYTFRKLTQRLAVPITSLIDILVTCDNLDTRARLRFISALTATNVPPELMESMSHTNWPFILSLERTVTRMHNEQDTESIALVLLAELMEKSEREQLDWLFNVDGRDLLHDALSCAAMRLFSELAYTLHDLPAELRDFVSCSLVTMTTSFSANAKSRGPTRLCAALGLQLFTRYAIAVRTRLSILTLSESLDDAAIAEQSRLTTLVAEWNEFIGRETAAHAMAWFYWHVEKGDATTTTTLNIDIFPTFFRVQLCKALCSCESTALFDVIHNPTPLLTAHIEQATTPTSKQAAENIVRLVTCEHTELQLTAIHLLERELGKLLQDGILDTLDDEKEAQPPTSINVETTGDEDDKIKQGDQQAAIGRRLGAFFVRTLIEHTTSDDPDHINSIDPTLAHLDLLVRVLHALDLNASTVVCTTIEESFIVQSAFTRLCAYLSFAATPKSIRRHLQQQPSHFFVDRRSPIDGTGDYVDDQFAERLLTVEGYALSLYRRTLEAVPALFREWYSSIKDASALKTFTKTYVSPLLIEQELNSVAGHNTDTFTLRARPQQHELFARYAFEDLRLEVEIAIPTDYPLSKVDVRYDTRNVLAHGINKNLHKNLFAFINNRNGALVDGVLHWKQSVQKHIEGAESCSICLSVISSSNYRLPRLRCRTCGNKFHDDCMFNWMKTSAQPTCPLCRTPFN